MLQRYEKILILFYAGIWSAGIMPAYIGAFRAASGTILHETIEVDLLSVPRRGEGDCDFPHASVDGQR